MKSSLILAVLVAVAALVVTPSAGADETAAGLRQGAQEALVRAVDGHADTLTRLDDAYREAVRVERNRHAKALSVLLDEALQREDLETAMAISKQIERATAALDAPRVVHPSGEALQGGVRVIAARWGMGTRWIDVTERVGDYLREPGRSVTVNHRSLGDPAPRWKKTLFVAFERNGEHEVAVIAEGRRLSIP